MYKVSFLAADYNIKISNRKFIRTVISKIFEDEGLQWSKVKVIFCSDNYLLSINKQFLKHNFYTDIITFPLHNPNAAILGEIYISIDRIKENAKSYSVEFNNELLRVVIHGILHLCGYKDKTANEVNEMRGKENQYLKYYLTLSRETNG